jgi:hypothetical protein
MENIEIKSYIAPDAEDTAPENRCHAVGIFGLPEDGRRVKGELAKMRAFGFNEPELEKVKLVAEVMLAQRTLELLGIAFKIPEGMLEGANMLLVKLVLQAVGMDPESLGFAGLKVAAAVLAQAASADAEELAMTATASGEGGLQ